MKPEHPADIPLKNQSGAAAIIVALVITVLLGIAALAIDIGYRNVAKNELQNIVDAAALAGAGELGQQYLDGEPYSESDIGSIAQETATTNASGFIIEVQVGTWIDDRNPLFQTEDCTVVKCNAVRAIARRGSPGGISDGNPQVPTFFAKIWKITGLDVQADAVAALTGATKVGPGELELPIGISTTWFESDFCDHNITFYPTSGEEGCAGWHTYEDWPASNSKVVDILEGLEDGTFTAPGVDLDLNPETEFVFTGGNLSGAKEEMWDLYDAKKDPVTGIWETKVAIYDLPCGENPQGRIPITGFATVEVSEVIGPPIHLIVTAKCGEINEGYGGGSYYGTWGVVPGLVEEDE